jgi:hypothetical protein
MSQQRLKRLARLESRQVKVFVPFDDAAAAASLRWLLTCFAAVAAGKACLVPRYGPNQAPSPAMAEAMRYLDRIAARLPQDGR